MSDNNSAQYRAIQSLQGKLVEACTPEVNLLIHKAWSKGIIDKEQLQFNLDSSNTPSVRASTLVSAIVHKMKQDSTVFDKFLFLLKDFGSLKDIAKLLENEVAGVCQADIPSQSTTNDSTKSHRPQVGHRNQSVQTPKLEPVSDTYESGFIGSVEDPGPIAGEQSTGLGGASASGSLVYLPAATPTSYLQSFQRLEGNGASSVTGLATKHVQYQNLSVSQYDRDVTAVTEEAHSDKEQPQDEMVLPASKEACADGHRDDIDSPLEQIRHLNENKNEMINELQVELKLTKESQESLTNDLKSQREDNHHLQFKLKEKELQIECLKHEHEEEVIALNEELKEKNEEIKKMKELLAQNEKQNEEKQELQCRIKELKKQLKEKNTTLEKKTSEHQQIELKHKFEILKINEELHQMKVKETDSEKKLCELKVNEAEIKAKLACKETELACKETELEREKRFNSELKLEKIEKKLEKVGETHIHIDKHREVLSDMVPKEEHETAIKVHTSNSISKDDHDALLKEKDATISEQQTKINELKNSLVDLRVAKQESQVEKQQSYESDSSGLESPTE